MDRKKEIKEELEKISPFLADLKKEQNFKVPTNYFNDLEEDLWKQVRPQPTTETTVVPKKNWLEQIELALASLFQPRLALSLASLLLMLTAGWYFMQQPTDVSGSLADNLPSLEEASDYLAEHIDDFDADLLMQLELGEEELSQISENSFDDEESSDSYFDEMLDDLDKDDLEQLL